MEFTAYFVHVLLLGVANFIKGVKNIMHYSFELKDF